MEKTARVSGGRKTPVLFFFQRLGNKKNGELCSSGLKDRALGREKENQGEQMAFNTISTTQTTMVKGEDSTIWWK